MSATRVPPVAPGIIVKIDKGMGVGVAPKGTVPVVPQRQGVDTFGPRRMIDVPGQTRFQGGMGVAVAPRTINGPPQTVFVAVEVAPPTGTTQPMSEAPRSSAVADNAAGDAKKTP